MMPSRRELFDTAGHWLIDLYLGGRVLRFATAPLEVLTEDGAAHQYREGLADFTHGESAGGSADLSISVSLDVGESWAELAARFLIMERSRAVIRRFYEGQTLEGARVLLDGFVSGFGYGEQDEPVTFAVARRVWNHSRMMPLPGMVVDETTWPVRAGFETDAKILGTWYPMIWGTPGMITSADGVQVLPATEAILVEWRNSPPNDRRLLVAGHRVAASEVTIFDYTEEDAPVEEVLPVIHEADGVGRLCALVDDTGSGLTVEMGRVYYVGWAEPGFTRGEIAIEGAGDLIEWVLNTWTDVQIDRARFASVRDRLNLYRLSPYINTQVDPGEWLNAEILKLLPVEPQQGAAGLWYRMRRIAATEADAVTRLDADHGRIQRASAIVSESDSIVNECTVEYAPDRSTNRYTARVIVGPDDNGRPLDELQPSLTEPDDRYVGSYRAQVSVQQFGRQPVTMQAGAVYDPATAVRIARDIVDAQALPRRSVAYTGELELAALSEGDVVILNDTAAGLIDVLAEVRDVTTGGPDVALSFLLFDDPATLGRLMG